MESWGGTCFTPLAMKNKARWQIKLKMDTDFHQHGYPPGDDNRGYNRGMDNTYTVAYFQTNQPCVNILTSGVDGSELKSADRALSLISLSARQAVDAAVVRGLCYRRFKADITLNSAKMPPKEVCLACGALIVEILSEGKQCFPECILLQDGLPCPLIDGVRFARVVQPGQLCQGDALTVVEDA